MLQLYTNTVIALFFPCSVNQSVKGSAPDVEDAKLIGWYYDNDFVWGHGDWMSQALPQDNTLNSPRGLTAPCLQNTIQAEIFLSPDHCWVERPPTGGSPVSLGGGLQIHDLNPLPPSPLPPLLPSPPWPNFRFSYCSPPPHPRDSSCQELPACRTLDHHQNRHKMTVDDQQKTNEL